MKIGRTIWIDMNIIRAICFYSFLFVVGALKTFLNFVVYQKRPKPVPEMLQELLNKSFHIPFFKEKLGGLEWKDLPVLTKKDYVDIEFKEKYPPMSFNPLMVLWQINTGRFTYKLATGGSSALPLTVVMDKQHLLHMAFSFFLCWYKMGWRPGQKLLVFYPNKIYDLEIFQHYSWFFNLLGIRFELFDKLDLFTAKRFVTVLSEYKPELLIIFPSPLNILSYLINKHDLDLGHQPPLINVSGETFFKCQRDNIARIFNKSKIQDSYGSVELGEIAHEVQPGKLQVFEHHAFVESIPSEDSKKEIAVTIFGNGTFPMIRYKMGDVMEIINENGKQYLSNINGKPSNKIVFNEGNVIYPRDLDNIINEANNIFRKTLGKKQPIIVDVRLVRANTLTLSLIFSPKLKQFAGGVIEIVSFLFMEKFGFMPTVEMVDGFEHDYRLKYRAIVDKTDEPEWAGGIIGQKDKMKL